MAFPTYIAKGTFTESTSNPSANPPLPAGIQNGDLIIAVVSYPVTNTPSSSDTAWTLLAQTSTGTSGNAGCIGVGVFYAIYAGSALGGFSTNASFPLKTYQTYAFRKARIPSISATSVQSTAATSWTLPSITTADNDSFVFFAIGNDRDAASTTNVSGYTNSNLANITEIHDQTVATGLGGGLATVYAEEATPSSIGTTSCTSASSNTAAFITFAIAPAVITADGGTYSYTGTAATLTYTPVGAFTLTADPGTYSYTGTAASLSALRVITADPGVYSYTGTDASLERNLTITADAGSYSYSGTAANLTYKYPESASDSTLGTVSGTAYVAISDILKVSTNTSGGLTFSGELTFQPQTMTNGVYNVQIIWRYRTVGGSFIDVGSGITATTPAEVDGGSLIVTGEVSAATTQGSLSTNTNYEVQLYARRTVSSPTNTIEFSGTAQVDATGNAFSLTADAGSYSYAGTAAALLAARKVIANSGSYTYTGTAAGLAFGRKVAADPGTYAYTGTAATTLFNRKVAADAGTYSYTGTAATLIYGQVYTLTADSGVYAYSGTSATLTYTSGLFNILLGSSTVSSVKLGTTTVTKVYLGTTKVFG